MTGDPYAALGLRRDADDEQIRAAYERRLDLAARAGDLAGATRMHAAYALLSDPVRRSAYDRAGETAPPPRPAATAPAATPAVDRWREWSALVVAAPSEPRAATPRHRGFAGERRRTLTIAVLVCAVLAGGWRLGWRNRVAASTSGPTDVVSEQAGGGAPPLHLVTGPVRLAPRVNPPAGSGGYTVERSVGGQPVRWDPCRPVRYVLSGRPLFAGGDGMLRQAIATVSRETGLRFVAAGRTTESASSQRPAYQPARYGSQWAPVLVAWTDAAAVPDLSGDVVGLGGADTAFVAGSPRLVSGIVYLDDPDLARMLGQPFGTSLVRTTMLHELGHLVGLGHVSDPQAVMYPDDHASSGYDAGDLRGLAAMGAGPCFPSY